MNENQRHTTKKLKTLDLYIFMQKFFLYFYNTVSFITLIRRAWKMIP
jgi:hypothetical protein